MREAGKFILDATSGWRQMWTDKNCPFAVFVDKDSDEELEKRHTEFEVKRGGAGKSRLKFTNPTVAMDYRQLDFPDDSFKLVVFDPPQLMRLGKTALLRKKYGALNPETWQSDIKRAAHELWRVLQPYGVLVFKWSNREIPIKQVLKLFPAKPLFGQQMHVNAKHKIKRKSGTTYWFCFMKIPERVGGKEI